MRHYAFLKERLRRLDIRRTDLAEHIGRSEAYVSMRMGGNGAWGLDEMYKILDLIGEKEEALHFVFPRDGINEESYEEIMQLKNGGGKSGLPQDMCVLLVPRDEAERMIRPQPGLRVVR